MWEIERQGSENLKLKIDIENTQLEIQNVTFSGKDSIWLLKIRIGTSLLQSQTRVVEEKSGAKEKITPKGVVGMATQLTQSLRTSAHYSITWNHSRI